MDDETRSNPVLTCEPLEYVNVGSQSKVKSTSASVEFVGSMMAPEVAVPLQNAVLVVPMI